MNRKFRYFYILEKKSCPHYDLFNNSMGTFLCIYIYIFSLFEIIQSLYWAIYGLVDLEHSELEEPHEFTEFISKLMFGSYSWIAFVVLLNLLIAMMSNSYQNISVSSITKLQFPEYI